MQGPLCKQAAFPVPLLLQAAYWTVVAPWLESLPWGQVLGPLGPCSSPFWVLLHLGGPPLWLFSDCHSSLSSGQAPMSFLALPISPQGGFPGPGI